MSTQSGNYLAVGNEEGFYTKKSIKIEFQKEQQTESDKYEARKETVQEKYEQKLLKLQKEKKERCAVAEKEYEEISQKIEKQINSNLVRLVTIETLIKEAEHTKRIELLEDQLKVTQNILQGKENLIKELNESLLKSKIIEKKTVDINIKKRALALIGMDISNLINPSSTESILCDLFYSSTIEELLSSMEWSFKKKDKEFYPGYFLGVIEAKLALKLSAAVNLAGTTQVMLQRYYQSILEEARFSDTKNLVKEA